MRAYRVTVEGPRRHLGVVGLWNVVLAVRDGDPPTYRHFWLGLRSPVLYYGRCRYPDHRRPRLRLWPVRLGWGSGAAFLGPVFVLWTSARSRPTRYRRLGPVEIAWPGRSTR